MDTKSPPGFQGFICELSGEKVSAAECLACAEAGAPGCRYGSPAVIAGIANNMRQPGFALDVAKAQREDIRFDYGFSATELLGCPRKKRLIQEYPWWDKPSSLYWAFRGNLMHDRAEEYAEQNPHALAEQRLFWSLRFQGKIIGLSGALDLLIYQPKQEGWVIVDYKTIAKVSNHLWRHICKATGKIMSDMPFPVNGKGMNCRWCGEKHDKADIQIVKVPFQPRSSHKEQLQLYALLVEKNAATLAAAVNARLEANGKEPSVRPDAPIVGAELVYMDMKGMVRAEVEIWPREDRIAFLKQKLAAAITPDMPPVLTDPGQTWQCRYCPVADYCETLAEAEAVVDSAYAEETAEFDEERALKELGF